MAVMLSSIRVAVVVSAFSLSSFFYAFAENSSVTNAASELHAVRAPEQATGGLLGLVFPLLSQLQSLNPIQLSALIAPPPVTSPAASQENESVLAGVLTAAAKSPNYLRDVARLAASGQIPIQLPFESLLLNFFPVATVPSQVLSQLRGAAQYPLRRLSATEHAEEMHEDGAATVEATVDVPTEEGANLKSESPRRADMLSGPYSNGWDVGFDWGNNWGGGGHWDLYGGISPGYPAYPAYPASPWYPNYPHPYGGQYGGSGVYW